MIFYLFIYLFTSLDEWFMYEKRDDWKCKGELSEILMNEGFKWWN